MTNKNEFKCARPNCKAGTWITKNGTTLCMCSMTTEHLRNALNLVRRKGPNLPPSLANKCHSFDDFCEMVELVRDHYETVVDDLEEELSVRATELIEDD